MNAQQLVGKNVAKYRKLKGLTQERLAQDADVTEEYISQIENQKRNPSVGLLERLCKVLGIDIVNLFEE